MEDNRNMIREIIIKLADQDLIPDNILAKALEVLAHDQDEITSIGAEYYSLLENLYRDQNKVGDFIEKWYKIETSYLTSHNFKNREKPNQKLRQISVGKTNKLSTLTSVIKLERKNKKFFTIFAVLILVLIFVTYLIFFHQFNQFTQILNYIEHKQYNQALSKLKTITEEFPDNSVAWFYKGFVEGEKSNYEEMNNSFANALGSALAKTIKFRGRELLIKDAIDRYRNEQFADKFNNAVSYYNRALKMVDKYETRLLLDSSLVNVELARQIKPKEIEPIKLMTQLYIKLKKNKEAELLVKESLKNNPEDENLLITAGYLYFQLKDFTLANRYFKTVLTRNPNSKAALTNLGINEMALENWDKAAEYLLKAHVLDPNDINICYNIGVINYQNHQYKSAIPFFLKVIKATPEDQEVYEILGYCYIQAEMIDEGISLLEEAIQKYSQNANLWQYLAILYAKKGMVDKAKNANAKYDLLQNK